MNKSVVSYAVILSLCAGVACPVLADADDVYMDWSYASGLDPKPRPTQEAQGLPTKTAADNGVVTDDALAESEIDLDFDIDFGSETTAVNTAVQHEETSWDAQSDADYYSNTSYTFTQSTEQGTTDNSASQSNISGDLGQNLIGGSPYHYVTKNGLADGTQSVQIGASHYQQVPINTIQTPAQIQTVNKQVKVQYPVTKQYPISVQYPVTIQKDITVRRPMVVQQPIVVQRPIVMHQPVTVQQQPVMVQQQPVMVQQQPTVVQKQPIVVTTPVMTPVKPATCSNVPTLATAPVAFVPCPQKKIHSTVPAQMQSMPTPSVQPCPMQKVGTPAQQVNTGFAPIMPAAPQTPTPIMTSAPVASVGGCAGNCVFSGTFTGSFQPVGSSK